MKSIADMLADAREYLDKHDWAKHTLHVQAGGKEAVCAVGAIVYSQPWDATEANQEQVFEEHRDELIPICQALVNTGDLPEVVPEDLVAEQRDKLSVLTVTNWNDSWAENKQEVLDLFAKAEKIERAGFDPDAA